MWIIKYSEETEVLFCKVTYRTTGAEPATYNDSEK